MSERFPLVNNNLHTLRKAYGYGPRFDLHALHTRDYLYIAEHFFGGVTVANRGLTTTTGSGATAWAINAAAGGRAIGVTGNTDDSQATMHYGTSQITGDMDAVWNVCFQLSAVADVKAEIGFSNDPTTVGAINNLDAGSNVPTLVSTITDCVVAIYDVDAARDNWQFAGARASTAWRDSTLGAAAGSGITHPTPAAGTYQWIQVVLRRVDLATDDMVAVFYVDGVEEAYRNTGAVSNTTAIYPYVMVQNRAANANVTARVRMLELYALYDTSA